MNTTDRADLLRLRERHASGSMSLAYDVPLEIVRGSGTRLFDADGRSYLDAVNNVPHVGHCHPRVVEALCRQAATLNTNTRYLHPAFAAYTERLSSLFAPSPTGPMDVVFLVNSGSEANELALRLAEAVTGGSDWIVVEAGYHGNTRRLIERSHYKFAGPGGFDSPDGVHVVPLPDPYRGLYRAESSGGMPPDEVARLADAYVAHVRQAAESARDSPGGIAGIIAEPLIGCGGQVVPPDGWLRNSFRAVRAAGGVCIADEVQVGLGRVGTHWWAFEKQGAVPDIVTLGKPIGNGHPLGAVVTTRAIADALNPGMEWFNTFGGNPVSCAVGLAVLDVIADEGLLENARMVGSVLKTRIREAVGGHPRVGHVRGEGLYIGIDLVRDKATREPNGALATRVANGMKDRGVLISTDGPHGNVLKIKPPIVFSMDDVEVLVAALQETLAERPS